MKRCKTCKWWGKNEHDSTDNTGQFRFCRHPNMSEQNMTWTQAYDDCGEIAILVNKNFGCIGYEKKNEETEI